MALHCPATLLVAPAPRDAKGVASLVDALTGDRVLAVVRAPDLAVGTQLAERLGAVLEDEVGLAADEPDPATLDAIADLHRGETVLVLTPPGEAGGAPFVRLELD